MPRIPTLRFTFLLTACAFAGLLPFRCAAAPAGVSSIEEKRETFLSAGHKISIEVFAPAKPGRYPAVLVLHSSAGTLFGKREMEDFSRALARHGMTAFFVRYYDRTGTIFAGDAGITKHLHEWEDTVEDTVNYAAAHPRVRRDSIGIFGYSLGAFLAVSVASRDRRVDAVAELAGGIFTYLGGKLQRVPPTLILYGTADQRVDPHYARELERVARQHGARPVVKTYPGEGHILSTASLADASARSVDFLVKQLRAGK